MHTLNRGWPPNAPQQISSAPKRAFTLAGPCPASRSPNTMSPANTPGPYSAERSVPAFDLFRQLSQ